MKIWLFCHQFFPEFYFGTETVTLNTALELQKNGHEVTVITGDPSLIGADDEPVESVHYDYQGLKVIRFCLTDSKSEKDTIRKDLAPYWNDRVAENLVSYLQKQKKPDIAHILHFAYIGAGIVPVLKSFSVPIVFTATDFFSICPTSLLINYDGTQCSGPNPDNSNCVRHLLQPKLPPEFKAQLDNLSDEDLGNLVWLACQDLSEEVLKYQVPAFSGREWFRRLASGIVRRRELMTAFFGQVDKIIVPSKVVRNSLAANGVVESKITTLPFGVCENEMPNHLPKEQSDHLRLVFIGQIAEHKGVKVLIEAVKSLPKHISVRLNVYGDLTSHRNYGDSILDSARNDDRISFMGQFNHDQINGVLRDNDVIVIPSLWSENTPLVLLTAQANHCPAIVSRQEGLCEIIEDGVNGLTFTSGDAKELADKIILLAENRPLLEKLTANSAVNLTIEQHAQQLMAIYSDLVSSQHEMTPHVAQP